MRRKLRGFGAIAVVTGGLTTGLATGLSPAVATAASANPYMQHENISIAFPQGSISNSDPMLKYIEQKFNITVNLVPETWSNYDQQSQLWAASGKLPDVFFSDEIGNSVYDQWVNQGMVQAIPSNLSAYPYVSKLMAQSDVKAFATNGKMYIMPLLLQKSNVLPADRGIVVRKDWMEKLHLAQPKTWAQFVNILKAFETDNPEHNKNVIGLTSNSENLLTGDLFENSDPSLGWWTKVNGKWAPSWSTTNEKVVVNGLHQLYSEGLLDKDYDNPNNPAMTKFINGQAGALDQQPKNLFELEKSWNTAHPTEKFSNYVEFLQMPPGLNGKRYQFQYFNWWGQEFISSNVDSTKMARILALFNYLMSPQGQTLVFYGFDGKDYKMQDGKIDSLHSQSWNISTAYPSELLWVNLATWTEAEREGIPQFNTVNPVPSWYDNDGWNMYQNFVTWYMKNTTPIDINWNVNAYVESLPALQGSTTDWLGQAVASSDPIQVWNSYVQQEMNAGLTNQIQQVNQKFANQNN